MFLVYLLLPPRHGLSAPSSTSTSAPASRADRAAHRAALPPPITRTSLRMAGLKLGMSEIRCAGPKSLAWSRPPTAPRRQAGENCIGYVYRSQAVVVEDKLLGTDRRVRVGHCDHPQYGSLAIELRHGLGHGSAQPTKDVVVLDGEDDPRLPGGQLYRLKVDR